MIGGICGVVAGIRGRLKSGFLCLGDSGNSSLSTGINKCIDWKKANTAPSTVTIMVKMEAQKLGITFK